MMKLLSRFWTMTVSALSQFDIHNRQLSIHKLNQAILSSVAVVGLDRTTYNVSENVGVVEVCAIVYSPDIDCPI